MFSLRDLISNGTPFFGDIQGTLFAQLILFSLMVT